MNISIECPTGLIKALLAQSCNQPHDDSELSGCIVAIKFQPEIMPDIKHVFFSEKEHSPNVNGQSGQVSGNNDG